MGVGGYWITYWITHYSKLLNVFSKLVEAGWEGIFYYVHTDNLISFNYSSAVPGAESCHLPSKDSEFFFWNLEWFFQFPGA